MTRRLLATLALTLAPASPAAAEPVEVTAQAKAANATFLRDIAPGGPAATICLVDTGVNENPDTTGVVARLALTGATSDTSPSLHGTQMAMLMGGRLNGFGGVGFWPSTRMISVRANEGDQDAFTSGGLIRGVRRCDEAAGVYGLKVILLAQSSDVVLSPEELADLTDTVLAARGHGMNVIAAAGNTAGSSPASPADTPGVLSVGASDSGSGELCSFSSVGADLVAPGCHLDGADPRTGAPLTTQQGTSASSAFVATALAALRSWRPDMTPDAAEQLLRDATTAGAKKLDVGAAFSAAGLGALVTPAAPPAQAPTPSQPAATPAPRSRLPRPRLGVQTRNHPRKVEVVARNRPAGAVMTVRIFLRDGRRWRRIASRTARSSRVTFQLRAWDRITVRFTDKSHLPSLTAVKRR